MDRPRARDAGDPLAAFAPGDAVEIREPTGRVWRGVLMPRSEFSGDRIVILKLDSGYNVGIRLVSGATVSRGERPGAPTPAIESTAPPSLAATASDRSSPTGPPVAVLTTGGTIASRVDYETGGVRPVESADELLRFYPDLAGRSTIQLVPVFDRLSENLTPDDWVTLARTTVAAFARGARGVVVTHGTDTMAYTAAALAFLLEELPGPVVLTGAQRSPDRPSSDGASNLRAALRLASEASFGEVVVVMHAGLSDDRFAIHRATRVRKMHSSRRDAFASRNVPPLGFVENGTVRWTSDVRPARAGPPRLSGPLESRVALVWAYPGMDPDRTEAFVHDARGVVVAGTGLGHLPENQLPWIRRAVDRGTVIAMTTQCLEGRADPFVYATGRELVRSQVVFLDEMLPEVAYVKMAWVLGRTNSPAEARALLLADRTGEIGGRRVGADG